MFDWKDKFNLSALLSCFSPIIILMWQCICSVSLFKGIYCSVVLSWGGVVEEELDGLYLFGCFKHDTFDCLFNALLSQ